MITFRLTAEEYARCCAHCSDRGINSISKLTRTAINLLLQEPSRNGTLSLEIRVSELENRIERLLSEAGKSNDRSGSRPDISLETDHA